MSALKIPPAWVLLRTTFNDWLEDNALRLSAALAYYSIFSIAPLLVLSVGLAGWFFGPAAAQGHLDDQLKDIVGGQAAKTIQSMVQSASQPSKSMVATIVGMVTLLLGASGVFGQLKDALNTIWEVKAKPGLGWRAMVRERVLSFGMVLVIGFLLLISLVLTAVLSAFNRWIGRILQLPDWLWGGAALVVSLGVIVVLFALIFKVLPDVKIDWQHVWIGAGVTALLFELGKFGLAYYLGKESTVSSFGAAGSVVLVLLWVYYASCILLFGAEFTKVYARATGGDLQPSDFAVPVTAEARAQQGMGPKEGPEPARESLPLIFATDAEPEEPSLPHDHPALAYIRGHMATGILGALGCGVAVGLASRAVPSLRTAGPEEQFRTGSKMMGAAALLLMTRFGRQAAAQLARGAAELSQKHLIPWK